MLDVAFKEHADGDQLITQCLVQTAHADAHQGGDDHPRPTGCTFIKADPADRAATSEELKNTFGATTARTTIPPGVQLARIYDWPGIELERGRSTTLAI